MTTALVILAAVTAWVWNRYRMNGQHGREIRQLMKDERARKKDMERRRLRHMRRYTAAGWRA